MHVLAADGCFGGDGFFYAPSINIDTASLEKVDYYDYRTNFNPFKFLK
jgi:hypothetical protein